MEISPVFVDDLGLYHHKPVVDGQPSSNNGWLYTAIAKHLGLPVKESSLRSLAASCTRITPNGLKFDRLPGKLLPPLSRDEVLGLVALGLMSPDWLKRNFYQFCNFDEFRPTPLWKVNWIKAAKSAWKIRNGHRNDLWTETDLWHFGFRLLPQDTYYVAKKGGSIMSPIHYLYFYISTYLSGNDLIAWLKMKDLGWEKSFWPWERWLLKRVDLTVALLNEFPLGHIFLSQLPPPVPSPTSKP